VGRCSGEVVQITELNISKSLAEKHGLKSINLQKLGKVVVIAGRNGSGKTRLLDITMGLVVQCINHGNAEFLRKIKNIDLQKHALHATEPEHKSELIRSIGLLQTELLDLDYVDIKDPHPSAISTRRGIFHNKAIIKFVPRPVGLMPAGNLNKQNLKEKAELISQAEKIGVEQSPECTLPKIQQLQDMWREATHQDAIGQKKEARDLIINEYQRLVNLIDEILGAKLERNTEGEATLFGRRIDNLSLSEGQSVLIQLAIAVHSQADSVRDKILILDEPENFLHPAATLDFLRRLESIVTNGQIIIATHSIHILAHFGLEKVWLMDNGNITRFSGSTQEMIEKLIGDESRVEKMIELLDSPARMATRQFALESLFPPKVKSANGSDDAQVSQIIDAFGNLTEKIRILDYGCGKGRFIATAFDAFERSSISPEHLIDYYGYDPSDVNEKECKLIIEQCYGPNQDRYFSDITKVSDAGLEETFDFILICNVFHEIDPANWLSIIGTDSPLSKLLKPDGHLLIVEDEEIPYGEKAFANGFHILGVQEMATLFSAKINSPEYQHSSSLKGRLSCHKLRKECINRVTPETRIACLTKLKKKSIEKIKYIRSNTSGYAAGKKHALWLMQFANASLSLQNLIGGE
jgi:ABC-type multidrug transport system ATPase subunit